MTDFARPASLPTLPSAPASPIERLRRLRWADAALEQLWARGLASRPPLEPAALIGRVQDAATLPDRSGWRARLESLCADLESHARLTPLGRTLAYGQLAAALRHRVRAEALWTRRPEILDRPLAPPIVVVGQMRSGSTRMQRLLACDPRLSATRFFESWNPVPLTGERGRVDDRPWRSRAALVVSRLLNPDFPAIHPTSWDAPDEEIGWHSIAVFGASFEAQWRVPRFTAAVEDGDAVPVYREFRQLLQTVGWLRGEDPARRWVLKVPQFTQDVSAILQVFPGATIIRLERDPVAVVGSSASLVHNQMAIQSDAVCPRWIGQETLRKVTLRHHRTQAALERAHAAVVRVDYSDMGSDWAGEMARVYRALGLPFTAEVQGRMAAFVAGSKRHRLERHRYALADYGLTEGEVRAAVADPEPELVAAE